MIGQIIVRKSDGFILNRAAAGALVELAVFPALIGDLQISDPDVNASTCFVAQSAAIPDDFAVGRYTYTEQAGFSATPEWAAEAAELAAAALAAARAETLIGIDADAEATRLLFLTPGPGQALEYQETAAEYDRAKAVLDASGTPAAADYPLLKAELDAQIDAEVSPVPSFADIIGQIGVEVVSWRGLGAEIKRLRRGAKLRAGAAALTTPEEVRAVRTAIVWPTP